MILLSVVLLLLSALPVLRASGNNSLPWPQQGGSEAHSSLSPFRASSLKAGAPVASWALSVAPRAPQQAAVAVINNTPVIIVKEKRFLNVIFLKIELKNGDLALVLNFTS